MPIPDDARTPMRMLRLTEILEFINKYDVDLESLVIGPRILE